MAINPEEKHHAVVVVDYENWTSTGAMEHRVVRMSHVQPWLGWASRNRLEPAWNSIPQGNLEKSEDDRPFQTEKKPIGNGTGKVELKWKIWDDSKKLTSNEKELYAVMRAEKHFIDEGFTKIASKYVNDRNNENTGVDSFFWRDKDGSCVFCESKFTTLRMFERCKRNPRSAWQFMNRTEYNDRPCRQMSWEWIQDRASRALRRPVGLQGLTIDQKASIVEQSARMLKAANRMSGRRVINVFSAAQVPVYPGVYLFVSGERGSSSINELSIEWPFPYDRKEFIELGQDFDDWLQRQPSHVSNPPPSPIILR